MFFAVYVFIWNLNTLGNPPIRINSEYDWVANTFRLNQKWGFFAPSVLREDGWYVIVGTFADGSQRELLQNTEIISFEKPQLVSATYPDYRWRRYLMNLYLQDYTSQRPHFARYLCHHYSAHSQVQLDYIEMYFMLEINLPENKTSEPEKTLLYEGSCVQ